MLGEAISKALRYVKPPDPLAAELAELQASLRGSALEDRVAYALTQSPWDLINDEDEIESGRPTLVIELARELGEASHDSLIGAVRQSHLGDQQTAALLFEEVARLRADDHVLALLEAREPLPTAAHSVPFAALRACATTRGPTLCWHGGLTRQVWLP